MTHVVTSFLGVLVDDGLPMLIWEPRCHASLDITHGCACGSSRLVTIFQEVGCVFDDLGHVICFWGMMILTVAVMFGYFYV